MQRLLRCPECGDRLELEPERASCGRHAFQVRDSVPRLLPADLLGLLENAKGETVRARTYRSFGFEWSAFRVQLDAYERNFRWYVEPLGALPLAGLTVLDAGCGMGRHAHHLLKSGARVVGLDASLAVEVAAANNRGPEAIFVQGDLLRPPVARDAFDLVCCLGVLHHIEDTSRGLSALVSVARPGGRVLVFLYHDGAEHHRVSRLVLRMVTLARTITTRMPLPLLKACSWLLAVGLWVLWVSPLKLLSRIPRWQARVAALPLAQYVEYPFRVLWNDQFDRFSAPLEKRYSRAQVEDLLAKAGLVDVHVLGGYGWRAVGTRPTG
jgi:SAM-dependent methyltransferase